MIRAPYSGIVVKRNVEVGETVTVGRALMTGLSLEHLRAVVEIPQQHIGPLRQHRKARVILPGGRSVPATELRIPPSADPDTHTFRVLVTLPEGDYGVFPGSLVKVAFVSGEERVTPRAAGGDRESRRSDRRVCRGPRRTNRVPLRADRHAGRGRADPGARRPRGRRPGRHGPDRRRHRLQGAAGADGANEPTDDTQLGISGRIARRFLDTEITPLLALVGLLLGLFAVFITPREEEPQINVTFANVFIPFPGASAREVESLVTTPAEQIASEIDGVEHVYSASQPGMAVLTVRFVVGTPRTDAIVRLYNAFYQHLDWMPAGVGVGPPLIKPKGIDDVPVVAATLWSEDPALGADDLLRVAHSMEAELQRVPGTRNIETIGGPDRVVRVTLDPQRLAGYGLAMDDLERALASANASAAPVTSWP